MKTNRILLIAVLTFSSMSFAKVTDWNSKLELSEKQIVELIEGESWDLLVGDDGRECSGEFTDYALAANATPTEFVVNFLMWQNGEFEHGCLVGSVNCQAKLKKKKESVPANLSRQLWRSWSVKLSCKYF